MKFKDIFEWALFIAGIIFAIGMSYLILKTLEVL